MINILMSGCNGRMGQVITRLAGQSEDLMIAAGFDIADTIKNSYPVFTDLSKCDEKLDVIIDFSNPNAFSKLLAYAKARKLPLVMCTTGLTQAQLKQLEESSKNIPVFFSANMSLGVNLLIDLVKKAAKVLEHNFDIEIICTKRHCTCNSRRH